jgi:hypothetical protein
MQYIKPKRAKKHMDAIKTSPVEINEEKEELKSILKESPLYLDMSLLERENFLRYLASIVRR